MTTFAFFDVDDTLIAVKSMFSFLDYWYGQANAPTGRGPFEQEMAELKRQNAPWELLNRRYYAHFAGWSVAAVEQAGKDWFQQLEQSSPNLLHAPLVRRLKQHQANGEEPVFISGSFPALLQPLASRLAVRHLLCSRLETRDGHFTGQILPPQTIGQGKADAIAQFLVTHGADAALCHGYGDDISDRPMLEAIGHPVVVAGGRGLEDHARVVGWPIVAPRD